MCCWSWGRIRPCSAGGAGAGIIELWLPRRRRPIQTLLDIASMGKGFASLLNTPCFSVKLDHQGLNFLLHTWKASVGIGKTHHACYTLCRKTNRVLNADKVAFRAQRGLSWELSPSFQPRPWES